MSFLVVLSSQRAAKWSDRAGMAQVTSPAPAAELKEAGHRQWSGILSSSTAEGPSRAISIRSVEGCPSSRLSRLKAGCPVMSRAPCRWAWSSRGPRTSRQGGTPWRGFLYEAEFSGHVEFGEFTTQWNASPLLPLLWSWSGSDTLAAVQEEQAPSPARQGLAGCGELEPGGTSSRGLIDLCLD